MRHFDPNFLNRLTTESTLAELPYWEISLSADLPGQEAARVFEQDPTLPGILIQGGDGAYHGLISRERFYNWIGRRFGVDIFYNRPIHCILQMIENPGIALPHAMPIQSAAETCLRRQGDTVYEALVVTFPDRPPRIVDFRDLLVAETRLLSLAKEIAQAASTAKDRFLATMSHELRTPLTSIIGYAEIVGDVARERGDNDTEGWVGTIHSNGRHLLDLIVSILDFSKIEAGKMELDLRTFDLPPLIDDVRTTMLPLAAKNGNRLHISCPADIGAMHADPVKVRQNLLNLLSNACKFTRKGTIALEVRRRPEEVVFFVADTGIGMTGEQMARIFQPFVQADSSMTRKYGGTGLGLAITHLFCAMMGGSIKVRSEPERGTTFCMRLPAHVVPPDLGDPRLALGLHAV